MLQTFELFSMKIPNVNFTTKMLFLFILFLTKETISATPSPPPSSTELDPHDITQSINTSLADTLLQNVGPDKIVNLINEIKYHRSTYEIENTPLLEPFRDKIFFHNIEIRSIKSELDGRVNQPIHSAISYNFARNQVIIFVDTIYFKIYGYIGTEPGMDDVSGFRATLGYKSFTINATKQGEQFSINVDGVVIEDKLRLLPRHDNTDPDSPYSVLAGLIKNIESPQASHNLSNYEVEMLTTQIKRSIPSILIDNINCNTNFSHLLNVNFGSGLQPKWKLFSQNPVLLVDDKSQLYHYLIPTVSVARFNFSDIKLRGLWDYQYVAHPCILVISKNRTKTATLVYTKDISGSMNWYHGIEDVPNFEINFNASKIFARANHDTGVANVILDNYQVTGTNPDLLSSSEINKLTTYTKLFLESAIAFAILPSMSNRTSQNLVRESQQFYDETANWFKEKYSYTEPPQQSETDQKNTTTNQLNVNNTNLPISQKTDEPNHISLPNTTIKIIAKNYSNVISQIQVEFRKNPKFTREVNAVLIGTVHLNDNKSEDLALNLHCNFTKLKLTMIKDQLGPKENSTYEFQIMGDQDIELELPRAKNFTNGTINDGDEFNTKKKTDLTLLSTIKQRIFRNLKSIVYFPLDAYESVKMIDHYLLRYIDNVLKKCSLRRDTTTIT